MRMRITRRFLTRLFLTRLFLFGALLLPPAAARAQYQEVPPVSFTGPLSHPRYETGGFFAALQGIYWRQNRPLQEQSVAIRGFIDVDGSISGREGAFLGSGQVALDVEQVQGPGTWSPGVNLTFGYRFEQGTVLSLAWYHLAESRYSATASLAPKDLQGGTGLADTFLFSPVYNFPIDYAGNGQNLGIGNPGATFGIWNGASLMTIQFVQRFDMVDLSGRIPVWQTDNYRSYGILGPRAITMWEQFKWRTVDYDVNGLANNGTIADYRNTTSNLLYGVHIGAGNEWYLGDTPIGAFSVALDLQAALYFDFVKGRAHYQLADRTTKASRKRNMSALVPEIEGKFNLLWFPWEAIQFQIGYDFFAFFNTVASPRPIDFNVGGLDPGWDNVNRLLHGVSFGVGVVF